MPSFDTAFESAQPIARQPQLSSGMLQSQPTMTTGMLPQFISGSSLETSLFQSQPPVVSSQAMPVLRTQPQMNPQPVFLQTQPVMPNKPPIPSKTVPATNQFSQQVCFRKR